MADEKKKDRLGHLKNADPLKQMLDKIREDVGKLVKHETITSYGYAVDDIDHIFDDAEAKL